MMYAKDDLVKICEKLTHTRLERWLDEGWIKPFTQPSEITFNDLDRVRVDLICYLVDDLEIQEDALPVILSLLDQVYSLRGELRSLADAVAKQPETVRSEISITLRVEPKK